MTRSAKSADLDQTMRMFNPKMVTLARESRGYTQSGLAKALGVAQGTLSKLEGGQGEPAADLLDKLSHTLGYPKSLFFENVAFRHLPLSFFRKRASVSASLLKTLTARINLIRLQLEKLLRSVEVPPLRLPTGVDLGERRQSPEKIAKEIRLRWHVPSGPIANLTDLLENAGVLLIRCDLGTKHVDAVSIYEAQDGLPPTIFLSAAISGDRLRFSIAHEVAHVVLHHHLPFPTTDIEDEANRFASEFLMPASDIRGYLSRLSIQKLASLKPHWGVSMQAMLRRAEQLGAVTERRRRSLWTQIGYHGYRVNEPFPVPAEEPRLVKEIVNFHLDDLGYSEEEISDLVGLFPQEFLSQYGRAPALKLVRPEGG